LVVVAPGMLAGRVADCDVCAGLWIRVAARRMMIVRSFMVLRVADCVFRIGNFTFLILNF
jgi:hypothetical protein